MDVTFSPKERHQHGFWNYMEAYSYIEQYYLQRLLAWDEIDRSLKFEMDRVWNGPLYNILPFERFPKTHLIVHFPLD